MRGDRRSAGWRGWLGDTAPQHTQPLMPVGWLCSPGAQLHEGSGPGATLGHDQGLWGKLVPAAGTSLLAPSEARAGHCWTESVWEGLESKQDTDTGNCPCLVTQTLPVLISPL